MEANDRSDLNSLIALLKEKLEIQVAVFDAPEFVQVVTAAESALNFPRAVPRGRRPTAGLVMDLNPEGAVPPRPPDSERLIFAEFAVARVRGVWKLDVLRADGKVLDRTKREGGWGSVSQVIHHYAGGEWTARSMLTINRVEARRVLTTQHGVAARE